LSEHIGILHSLFGTDAGLCGCPRAPASACDRDVRPRTSVVVPALVKWARSYVGFMRACSLMVAVLAGLFVFTCIRM
jgi:hypothetical protein